MKGLDLLISSQCDITVILEDSCHFTGEKSKSQEENVFTYKNSQDCQSDLHMVYAQKNGWYWFVEGIR